jgi:hypothetical protein
LGIGGSAQFGGVCCSKITNCDLRGIGNLRFCSIWRGLLL